MDKQLEAILDLAVRLIETGETIFSCNAINDAIRITRSPWEKYGYLQSEYKAFTMQVHSGKLPDWWGASGNKAYRLAALKSFKDYCLNKESI